MASSQQSLKHVVIVVGCGPAGMSVANLMSKAGHEVVLLNRDIKFGGLAEYGIFPNKLKLRGGLRKTYWEILERPNVHYFGHVLVGRDKDIAVEDLRGLGASALVFATGARAPRPSAWKGIRPRASTMPRTWCITSTGCRDSGSGRLKWDAGWR